MKLSTLIKDLQEHHKAYGEMEVLFFNNKTNEATQPVTLLMPSEKQLILSPGKQYDENKSAQKVTGKA